VHGAQKADSAANEKGVEGRNCQMCTKDATKRHVNANNANSGTSKRVGFAW